MEPEKDAAKSEEQAENNEARTKTAPQENSSNITSEDFLPEDEDGNPIELPA